MDIAQVSRNSLPEIKSVSDMTSNGSLISAALFIGELNESHEKGTER